MTDQRHSGLTIAFHWATLIVLAATFATIELRVLFEKGTWARDEIKAWHFALGIAILLMTLARLANRFARRGQVAPSEGGVVPRVLAGIMHAALYACLIALPLMGWISMNAEGKAVPFFFGLTLPALTGPDAALGKPLEEWHEWLGGALYLLIAGHAAAAILHHAIMRDGTLRRMLPGRRAGERPIAAE
jgi:superoxide oxidase